MVNNECKYFIYIVTYDLAWLLWDDNFFQGEIGENPTCQNDTLFSQILFLFVTTESFWGI